MTERADPGQKNRRNRRKHSRGVRVILCAVVLFILIFAFNSISMYRTKSENQEKIAELNKQLEEQKTVSAELDEYEQYVGTPEYIEQIARERLGMIYPDETVH